MPVQSFFDKIIKKLTELLQASFILKCIVVICTIAAALSAYCRPRGVQFFVNDNTINNNQWFTLRPLPKAMAGVV